MRPIVDHRDPDVWTTSMDLVVLGVETIGTFTHEFLRFLRIARGSLAEVLTLFTLARRLHYLPPAALDTLDPLAARAAAMLTRLVQAHRRRV